MERRIPDLCRCRTAVSAFVLPPLCEKHANTANEKRTATAALGVVKDRPGDASVRWRTPTVS
jgi:hypothetical protein